LQKFKTNIVAPIEVVAEFRMEDGKT